MLSPLQQSIDLIQKSKSVLLAVPENINGDSLGSALALQLALEKLKKKAETVSDEPVPEKLKFLAGIEQLKNQISFHRDFIISVDTTNNKIIRLRYEDASQTLKIFLTAAQKIEQKDIKLEPGRFLYDLIVVIDAPDLESLGHLHEQNTELFFEKPILNIDHKAANEYFGEVNLIESTATSCAEIVYQLLEHLGGDLMDETIATNLLTGLISKTHSFQTAATTPQALNLASSLISRGGQQEKIIQCLYKTKPLNSLRLWGRLLGRADHQPAQNSLWLNAQANDFTSTNTISRHLLFILEEAEDSFPAVDNFFIFWPSPDGCWELLAQTKRPGPLQKINLELGGTIKHNRLLLKLNQTDLALARNQVEALFNAAL